MIEGITPRISKNSDVDLILMSTLRDVRVKSDFGPQWKYVTDPAEVEAILASINFPVGNFHQLMVAYDTSGIAYFGVYGAAKEMPSDLQGKAVEKDSHGHSVAHPEKGVKYKLVYDRKDGPADL
jgi:hypothetical protein